MADEDLKPLNTGDTVTLKAQLDDSVIEVLQHRAFDEEHFWSNVKLVLLVAASAVALVAQFHPKPFPESRPMLATCCILYVVFNVILQVITWLVDQDKIAVMFLEKAPAPVLRLVVRTNLPRFQDMYKLVLEDADSGKELAVLHKSVGAYFTQDGQYARSKFEGDVGALVAKVVKDSAKAK